MAIIFKSVVFNTIVLMIFVNDMATIIAEKYSTCAGMMTNVRVPDI